MMINEALVKRFSDLYVTYRGRFVIARDGGMFIPHFSKTQNPMKLLNSNIAAHLNHEYAIAIFAGPSSSKFVCFDVDLFDKEMVRTVIEGLTEYGFPKDKIYLSFSGGKGFHVEMFFEEPVFTDDLKKLYRTICAMKKLDTRKVEFRPTFSQSIKLPLSKHHKSGRICYYVDPDTFMPIKDPEFIFTIQQLPREFVTDLIRKTPEPEVKKHEASESVSVPIQIINGQYPTLQEAGTRHCLMLSIAVYERIKGKSQEEIENLLIQWVDEQNPDYINSTRREILYDASSIAAWVCSGKFVVPQKAVTLNDADIKVILDQKFRLRRRVLFLLIAFAKRFGVPKISHERISRYTGGSVAGVIKALTTLKNSGVIAWEQGKILFSNGDFEHYPNEYRYVPAYDAGAEHILGWDFQEETFSEAYLGFMRNHVPQERWGEVFKKKELQEIEETPRTTPDFSPRLGIVEAL